MDENHSAYYSLITGIYVLYGKPFKEQQRGRQTPR